MGGGGGYRILRLINVEDGVKEDLRINVGFLGWMVL